MDTSARRASPSCHQPCAVNAVFGRGGARGGPALFFLLWEPSPGYPPRRPKKTLLRLYVKRPKRQQSQTMRLTQADVAPSSNHRGTRRKLTKVWRPTMKEQAGPPRSQPRSLSPKDGTTKQRPLGAVLCQLPIKLWLLRWCHVAKVATALCSRLSCKSS